MTQHYDLIIIGGGLNGLSLASALAKSDLNIAIIDTIAAKDMQQTSFDGRTCAIAQAPKKMFEAIGVWDAMLSPLPGSPGVGEIRDIRIVDGYSPLFLHYDHKDIGDQPLGYIVENRVTRHALLNFIADYNNINFIAPARCTSIDSLPHANHITLDNGQQLTGSLLIAADGRGSQVRQHFGIKIHKAEYGQTAIVCTAKHEKNHYGTAVERFLPSGPFAILPLGGGHHSSLVWTQRDNEVPYFLAMSEDDFNDQMQQRFGDFLGNASVVGKRWHYPLTLAFTSRYTAQRCCLIGDAIHGIHPVAGQGLNLGLRDVAVLSELIIDTHRNGMDIGTSDLTKQYENLRAGDNFQMIAITDALVRMFSNDIKPLKHARRLGLSAVENLPMAKKFFMQHAMGVAGQKSRLLRGEPL